MASMPRFRSVCSAVRRVGGSCQRRRLYHTALASPRPRPPSSRAPWLQRHYPPSSLLRAHARIPVPPTAISVCTPYRRCPCRLRLPRLVTGTVPTFSPAPLSWSAASPTPAVHQVHLASSSLATSAFARSVKARLTRISHKNSSTWVNYFEAADIPLGCGPPDRSPSWLFEPLSRLTRTSYARAFDRFVASSAVEYATPPTGQFPGLVSHQQEEQPRRLHTKRRFDQWDTGSAAATVYVQCRSAFTSRTGKPI